MRIKELVGGVITNTRSVEALRTNVRKVPGALRRGENTKWKGRGGMVKALPLVIDEEEQLVLHDRAADSAAEHIPANFGLGLPLNPFCHVFALRMSFRKNSHSVAVKSVGAGLNRSADDTALEIPELGGRILRDQIEFLNRVRRWGKAHQVV